MIGSTRTKLLSLENIFASRGRTRIIQVLFRYEELSITQITQKTNLNHKAVLGHLEDLCELGIIKEKRYGRIRIFSLNTNSKLTLILMNFLRSWEYEVLTNQ